MHTTGPQLQAVALSVWIYYIQDGLFTVKVFDIKKSFPLRLSRSSGINPTYIVHQY